MSDVQVAIFAVLSTVVFIIAGFVWYWRATEWNTIKNRPDQRRYCTRCGTDANPEYHRAGSIPIEIPLILCFIVPAIFYHFWRRSQGYWGCPSCKSRNIIRLDSPIAVARLAELQAQGNAQ